MVTAEPFECEWDAGRSVAEHQIRVVATLAAGGRVVQTVRTKGLGYTENVDVDVVQVTVTVTDKDGAATPSTFQITVNNVIVTAATHLTANITTR